MGMSSVQGIKPYNVDIPYYLTIVAFEHSFACDFPVTRCMWKSWLSHTYRHTCKSGSAHIDFSPCWFCVPSLSQCVLPMLLRWREFTTDQASCHNVTLCTSRTIRRAANYGIRSWWNQMAWMFWSTSENWQNWPSQGFPIDQWSEYGWGWLIPCLPPNVVLDLEWPKHDQWWDRKSVV